MVGFPSTIFRIIYVTRMDQDTRIATLFDSHVDNTMASLHARHAGENNAKIDVEDEEKAKKETKGVDELREDDSEERRKRQKRKKKKRRRYSSSSDSDDTDNEARRSKKRRKKEKSNARKKKKRIQRTENEMMIVVVTRRSATECRFRQKDPNAD